MRTCIAELRVAGFGHFTDTRLELGRGLNLLVGPNEAGKSTLSAFVGAVLYGFERRGAPRRYEPLGGGPFGGALALDVGGRVLVVTRLGNRRRAEGELSVRSADGAALPDAELALALGGVTRELFGEVFAVTLEQLRRFEDLSSESHVAEALFAAGAAGAARVPTALAELEAAADALWSPRAQKRPVNVALAQLEEVRAHLLSTTARPERYAEALARRAAFGRDEALTRHALSDARARQAELQGWLSVRPAVVEALSLPAVGVPGPPREVLTRARLLADRLAAQLAEVGRRAEVVAALEREVQVAGAGEGVDLGQVRAALDAWKATEPLRLALEARRAQVTERRAALGVTASRLPGDEAWLSGLRLTPEALGRLRQLEGALGQVDLEQGRLEELYGDVGGQLERLAQARGGLPAVAPSPSAADLEDRALALQRAKEQARAIDGLIQQQTEARRARAALVMPVPARPPLSWWVVGAGLGALWACGVCSAVLGPRWLWPMLVGALGCATGVVWWLVRRARAEGVLAAASAGAALSAWRSAVASVERDAERTARQLAVAQASWSEAARAAGLGPGEDPEVLAATLVARRREAEVVERGLVERARLLAEEDHLRQRLNLATGRLEALTRQRGALRGEVEQLAGALGLPAGLESHAALEVFLVAQRAQDELRAIAALETAAAADAGAVGRAAQALEAVGRALGLSGAGRTLESAVGARLAEAQAAAAKRVERSTRQAEARRAEAGARAGLHEIERGLAEELAAGGAAELAQLERSVEEGEQRVQAAARRAALEAQVRLVARASVDELAQAFERGGPLEQRLADVQAEVLTLEAQASAQAQALGEARQLVASLETEGQANGLRAEEAGLTTRLGRDAQRVASARLAAALLQRARRAYEARHQPRVVRRASELFEGLTEGRFTRLVIDPARRSLGVLDRHGAAWAPTQLSRGTRELLLLAFRLAVVEDFGRTRVALPLVLDDVWVNLDPPRSRRLVQVLAELAAGHQILALTCHPHVGQLFADVGARVTAVDPRQREALVE